jgi:hypothetical protein
MSSSYASERPAGAGTAPPMTSWIGVLSFAGIVLLVLGGFQIVEGLTTLIRGEAYLLTADGLVEFDYQTWGWTHLVIGLITVATGFGVFLGQMWARVAGILIVAALTVFHFVFLASAPLFSSILIAIGIVVIYALAVHGRDVRA